VLNAKVEEYQCHQEAKREHNPEKCKEIEHRAIIDKLKGIQLAFKRGQFIVEICNCFLKLLPFCFPFELPLDI
jgi:hypothetical protein